MLRKQLVNQIIENIKSDDVVDWFQKKLGTS